MTGGHTGRTGEADAGGPQYQASGLTGEPGVGGPPCEASGSYSKSSFLVKIFSSFSLCQANLLA